MAENDSIGPIIILGVAGKKGLPQASQPSSFEVGEIIASQKSSDQMQGRVLGFEDGSSPDPTILLELVPANLVAPAARVRGSSILQYRWESQEF